MRLSISGITGFQHVTLVDPLEYWRRRSPARWR
jgi:hypothetical protein